jgi:hypothetical protein
MKTGPNYHSSHRKEEKSKIAFQQLMEPCVVNWLQKDYGVDAMVTLYNSLTDESIELDSNHFHVQLVDGIVKINDEFTPKYLKFARGIKDLP